jgi:hypothetical protein
MLRIDLQQVAHYGETFFSENDTAYLIFLVMGIVGYFTVPSVANYIVHAGGGNALLYKASNVFTGGSRAVMSTVAAGSSAAFRSSSAPSHANTSGYSNAGAEGGPPATGEYMQNKLSGKTGEGSHPATGDYKQDKLSGK